MEEKLINFGSKMYDLCVKLFPICRSITGNGVRQTLEILNSVIGGEMVIHEVPSGTKVFDWTVPKEWNIKDAWIKDSKGNKILDFKNNNLHVMGYSLPIDKKICLDELKEIIYTHPVFYDAIPYVTSYYKERYGFCMTQKQKDKLEDEEYHIFIDSELKDGSLTYGEIIIHGESKQEVFLSTYVCHPSMANNELSGPAVAIHLAKWLKSLPKRRYTYRIIFIPETIGSITYLSKNLEYLKEHVIAGFNITCVGDNRDYSLVESRYGNTLSDKVAKNVLRFVYPKYKNYSYLDRGSDERQYNAPGVDLPICVISRSKFNEYPEYHTSLDNLNFISQDGLQGAFDVYKECINSLENNAYYRVNTCCEPQMGKRNLYPSICQKGSYDKVRDMMNFIAYADGTNDLIDISNIIDVPVKELLPIVEKLKINGLIKEEDYERVF